MTIFGERDSFIITDDPERLDLTLVHEWLSTKAYWALGRPLDVVLKGFANSQTYSIYHAEVLAGFGRVVTDDATYAWICDVYIDEPFRARGLGHWLMETIVTDLTARGIPRMVLATRDAHEVYQDVGFTALEYPDRWMEIDRRANRHSLATQEI